MATDWTARIRDLTDTALPRAIGEIAAMEDELLAAIIDGELDEDASRLLRGVLVAIVETSEGNARSRLACGVVLGHLGDPRLSSPEDDAYWVTLSSPSGDAYKIGRYPVTNAEFRAWVDAGGYQDRAAWTDEGWAWLQACDDAWPQLASREDAAEFLVPNQPVVGVSWFEAAAFAAAHDARLPRWYERVNAVRGDEKRPYPWGDPFGEGHANTKEEVLGRPCAVGLYPADVTPEGVSDLAGNTGEWTAETAGDEFLLHPGSWDQPSLASWAKALTTEPPTARWSALGFRLAKD